MATLYDLKPKFQSWLRPPAAWLARNGVTANAVTLATLVLCLAQGAWIALQPGAVLPLLVLPVTLLFRMALNAVDGLMAKEHGQTSPRGAILNELSDVIADVGLYLPFALIPGVNAPLVVLVVLASVVAEMAGAVGPLTGASRRYDGPAGKADRALAFGLLAVLLGAGVAPGLWTSVYLAALLLLSVTTIWNRAKAIVAEAKKQR